MAPTEPSASASARNSPIWIVSATSAILLCTHLAFRLSYGSMKDGLDAIALGLAVVALSPWIATILKSLKFGGMEIQFQEVKDKVAAQEHEIDQLKFLILNFLSRWELDHLNNLAASGPFMVDLDRTSPQFEGELRHLRALNFIEHKSKVTIGQFFKDPPRTKNMHEYFQLTDVGRQYLKHRQDSLKASSRGN